MKSIDFSNNKLIGEIPSEVTDLVELVSLNLSRNDLIGPIPATIGQLKLLDSLDLSQNQLNGRIPDSLSQIAGLSVLDLSNNTLSGKIPLGTQLQSFNTSTYEGNPELCGLPLLKSVQKMNLGKPPSLVLVVKQRIFKMMQIIYGFMEISFLDSSSDFGEFVALYYSIVHGDMPISSS